MLLLTPISSRAIHHGCTTAESELNQGLVPIDRRINLHPRSSSPGAEGGRGRQQILIPPRLPEEGEMGRAKLCLAVHC